MKERPIIFNADMVRAILDGRKTQTRRIVKPQPPFAASMLSRDAAAPSGFAFIHDLHDDVLLTCPYGEPGDRLWVREAHYVWNSGNIDGSGRVIHYRATEPDSPCGGWTPSIHMPRWASRITLEVTGVRVERVQDISREDAKAEGVENIGGGASCSPWKNYRLGEPGEMGCHCSTPERSFMSLWESINGPESWERNDWVWVVEFKTINPA